MKTSHQTYELTLSVYCVKLLRAYISDKNSRAIVKDMSTDL